MEKHPRLTIAAFLLLCLILPSSALADEKDIFDDKEKKREKDIFGDYLDREQVVSGLARAWHLYIDAGYLYLDLSHLNDKLRANGYSKFDHSFLPLGGGAYFTPVPAFYLGVFGQWLGDTNIFARGSVQNEKTGGKADLDGGYFLLQMGGCFRDDNFFVTPVGGIGINYLRLEVENDTGGMLKNVFDSSETDAVLRAHEILIDLSLGFTYQFDITRRRYGSEGLSIGFRTGFIIAPFAYALNETYWYHDDGSRKSGPDSGFLGGHAMVTFGFGGAKNTEYWP